MAELHKYGTSGKFYVPLLLASTQNFASTSVITFASSDVTIVKDGSTYRDLTNTPTGVAMGSAAVFEVVTSASEMTAKKIAIQIKDETGALVQDQMLIIDTYGSSVAAHEFDLDQSIENSTMNAVVSVTSDVSGKVVGAVGSVTGAVGSVAGNVDGNVSGTVKSVSSDVAGKVVGSVASVLGNVDGNVTGSVGSISSTASLPANINKVGGSTSVFDNLEDDYDGTGFNKSNSAIGTAAALTANNDKTGYALASTAQNDLSDVVWNEPIAAHGTTNQFGGLIVDNLDANITSRMSSTKSVLGSTQAVSSVTGNVGGNVVGSVGSIASTAALPSNLVQVKASTVNTDNWVTNIDGTISSRMSSTKSVLGSTQGAQLSTTAVNAVSTGVKSEINDLIFTDASSDASSLTGDISIGNKMAWNFQRFFRHHQQDSSTQAIMDSGSTSSVAAKMTVTNTTGLQTVQEAST